MSLNTLRVALPAFASSGFYLNVSESVYPWPGGNPPDNFSLNFTQGGQLLTRVPPIPIALSEQIKIIGWSITFCGLIFSGATTTRAYGRFGALYGGLLTGTAARPLPAQSNTAPWTNPIQLPGDGSLMLLLWDGAQAPAAFPQGSGYTFPALPPLVPITISQQLALPLTLTTGQELAFGLWLTPSLTQNAVIFIASSTITISYELEPTGPEPWTPSH